MYRIVRVLHVLFSSGGIRRGTEVVKRLRLEIGWGHCAPRGFESHPLRHSILLSLGF
jgi:hypothetical protein